MTPLSEQITQFALDHIDSDNHWYHWKLNEDNLPFGITLPRGTLFQKNVALKHELHNHWKQNDAETRMGIVQYYVAVWGGIRANSPQSLELYASSTPEELVKLADKGIASWSKVLCITDPKSYAIFDARVSASLNALTLLSGEINSFFPILASRNNTIKKANSRMKMLIKQKQFRKRNKSTFYRTYLSMLNEVLANMPQGGNVELYTLEMLLFAKAEDLVLQAFPDLMST